MEKKKYKQKPKILVSEEVKTQLDNLGKKGDTYEDVIKELIKFYKVKGR